MALTIIQQPAANVFTKDIVSLKISSNNYVATAGQKEIISINTLNFRPSDGDSLVLSLASVGITIDFKTVLGELQTDFPEYTTQSNYSWYSLLLNYFSASDFINEYFLVSSGGSNTVKLESKNTELLSAVVSSYGTGVTVVSGVDRVLAENFRLRLSVIIGSNTLVAEKPEINIALPVNKLGESTFIINEILDAFHPQITLPLINNPVNLISYPDLLYTLKFQEHFGQKAYKNNYLKDLKAYKGGQRFTETENNVLLFDSPDFPHTTDFVFLTHQPKKFKTLSPFEPEMVTFRSATTGQRVVRFTLKNKLTNVLTVVDQVVFQNYGTKATLSLGWQSINNIILADYDLYSEYKVEVCLGNIFDIATVFFTNTYYLECHAEHYKYFVFENSVGGFDCLKLKGANVEYLKTKKSTADRIISAGYNPEDGTTYAHQIKNTKQFKIKSEYIHSLAYKKYLAELNYSDRIFELVFDDPKNPDVAKANYIPINTTTSKMEIYENREANWQMKFNYEYLVTETSF